MSKNDLLASNHKIKVEGYFADQENGMNKDTALILDCFEKLAESDYDINRLVYKNYVASNPEAEPHISYLDENMKGRMLDQIYRLLIGDVDHNYLNFEVRTHLDYGATVTLYSGLLRAIRDAVRISIGTHWTPMQEDAWANRINCIVNEINEIDAMIQEEKGRLKEAST